eukprot:14807778-Alexandrium_andersonii.AAC.1
MPREATGPASPSAHRRAKHPFVPPSRHGGSWPALRRLPAGVLVPPRHALAGRHAGPAVPLLCRQAARGQQHPHGPPPPHGQQDLPARLRPPPHVLAGMKDLVIIINVCTKPQLFGLSLIHI